MHSRIVLLQKITSDTAAKNESYGHKSACARHFRFCALAFLPFGSTHAPRHDSPHVGKPSPSSGTKIPMVRILRSGRGQRVGGWNYYQYLEGSFVAPPVPCYSRANSTESLRYASDAFRFSPRLRSTSRYDTGIKPLSLPGSARLPQVPNHTNAMRLGVATRRTAAHMTAFSRNSCLRP